MPEDPVQGVRSRVVSCAYFVSTEREGLYGLSENRVGLYQLIPDFTPILTYCVLEGELGVGEITSFLPKSVRFSLPYVYLDDLKNGFQYLKRPNFSKILMFTGFKIVPQFLGN